MILTRHRKSGSGEVVTVSASLSPVTAVRVRVGQSTFVVVSKVQMHEICGSILCEDAFWERSTRGMGALGLMLGSNIILRLMFSRASSSIAVSLGRSLFCWLLVTFMLHRQNVIRDSLPQVCLWPYPMGASHHHHHCLMICGQILYCWRTPHPHVCTSRSLS